MAGQSDHLGELEKFRKRPRDLSTGAHPKLEGEPRKRVDAIIEKRVGRLEAKLDRLHAIRARFDSPFRA